MPARKSAKPNDAPITVETPTIQELSQKVDAANAELMAAKLTLRKAAIEAKQPDVSIADCVKQFQKQTVAKASAERILMGKVAQVVRNG